MFLMLTLCKPVIKSCVAPSAQSELLAGVDAARTFAQDRRDEGAIRQARARCFGAVRMIEDITAEAVEQARWHLGAPTVTTPLDTHADRVTLRYGRLGAHFATSAVCHLLDATAQPSELLTVYGDLEGARAYLLTGLGAARHAPFRKAAWDQAHWEATRHRALADAQSQDTPMEGTLAVQVFHEYLGGRYRAQAEGIRSEMNAFIEWALASISLA